MFSKKGQEEAIADSKSKRKGILRGSRARHRGLHGVLAAAAILVFAPPFVCSAGMVLDEKTEIGGGPPMQGQAGQGSRVLESKTYLEGRKVRTETQGHVWILDFDKGLFTTLNPAAKTYTEMKLEDLREAQKQAMQWMSTLQEQMKEKLKTMPPESREAMQKKLDSMPQGMLGKEKPVNITVKPVGEDQNINGFSCKAYDVYEDGDLTTRYWLAPSVSAKAFDTYQKELSQWLEGMGPLGASRLREWEHLQGKGFPIKVTRLKPIAGQATFSREMLKIEEKPLPESIFQPPTDYKRTEGPALPQLGQPPGKMPSPK